MWKLLVFATLLVCACEQIAEDIIAAPFVHLAESAERTYMEGNIRIYEDFMLADKEYAVLKQIEASVCRAKRDAPPDAAAARDRAERVPYESWIRIEGTLRELAVESGANAISGIRCVQSQTAGDQEACPETIRCTADAVRIDG